MTRTSVHACSARADGGGGVPGFDGAILPPERKGGRLSAAPRPSTPCGRRRDDRGAEPDPWRDSEGGREAADPDGGAALSERDRGRRDRAVSAWTRTPRSPPSVAASPFAAAWRQPPARGGRQAGQPEVRTASDRLPPHRPRRAARRRGRAQPLRRRRPDRPVRLRPPGVQRRRAARRLGALIEALPHEIRAALTDDRVPFAGRRRACATRRTSSTACAESARSSADRPRRTVRGPTLGWSGRPARGDAAVRRRRRDDHHRLADFLAAHHVARRPETHGAPRARSSAERGRCGPADSGSIRSIGCRGRTPGPSRGRGAPAAATVRCGGTGGDPAPRPLKATLPPRVVHRSDGRDPSRPRNGRGRNGVSTVASARQRRLPTRPRASATEAHASASSLRTVPLPLGRADPTCTRTRPPLRIDPADRRAPPWIPTPVVGCDRHRARRPWGRAGAAGPRGGPHELRRKEALTRPPEASSLAAGDATGAGERSDRP